MKTLEEFKLFKINANANIRQLLEVVKIEKDIIFHFNKKYLMFLDDRKFNPISCFKLIRGFKNITSFNKWDHLRFVSINELKQLHVLLHKLNSSNRYDKIFFNDGNIIKNTLYTTLRLGKGIYFIENEKYPIKLVECQIRSFCQLMEEMGSKKITISYDNFSVKSKKLNSDIKNMAGDLGFEISEDSKKERQIKFELLYPKSNNSSAQLSKV